MKKLGTIFVAFLLIFSFATATSMTSTDEVNIQNEDPNSWDCWVEATDIYEAFDAAGHSREKCIEMGSWAYDFCMNGYED